MFFDHIIYYLGIGGFKLLGVPPLPHKSDQRAGDLISKATTNLLNNWECKDSVYGMCFDTTSSNTGHLTAACVAIQRELGSPLLWLACRHHIGEVILDEVWNVSKIETSKSPDVTIFKSFREKWDHISHYDTSDLSFPKSQKKLQQKKDAIINLLKDSLLAEFTRGDYKELVQLSLLYLSGEVSEGYRFAHPGALHKARWMAKLIYSIKIVLMSEKIQRELRSDDVLSNAQLTKLQKFVMFAVYVYVPWWLTCPVASAAPLNDLKLIANVIDYRKCNKCCADGALDAISRHMWYLTEELVPLALFSSQVDGVTKRKMADKLNCDEKRVNILQHFNTFLLGKRFITCAVELNFNSIFVFFLDVHARFVS